MIPPRGESIKENYKNLIDLPLKLVNIAFVLTNQNLLMIS